MLKEILKTVKKKYDYFFLRRKILKFKKFGKHSEITQNSKFGNPENIEIGDYCYIGPEAYIWAVGGLIIDENVILGPRVTIHTSNHRYENANMLPYDNVSFKKPVHIESNVWLGSNVLICPGVTIGEGSVIAMGSVVVKDVPKCSIVGGNPAKLIKTRNVEHYEILKEKSAFYMELKKTGKIDKHKFL